MARDDYDDSEEQIMRATFKRPKKRYPQGPGFVKDSRTSARAAAQIEDYADTQQALVEAYIRRSGPVTDDDGEVDLHIKHQSYSARRIKLHELKKVFDTGRERRTRSDRWAALWDVCTPEEHDRLCYHEKCLAKRSS